MSDEKVLDFVNIRNQKIEKKRRSLERIVFQNFLGAYTVLDSGTEVYPISLVDISRDGCLFQIPKRDEQGLQLEKDKEIILRMYFTKDSYIPIVVNVRHQNDYIDRNGSQYKQFGCSFDKTMSSFEALESFIDFMYKFAELSKVDKGDQRLFFR